VKSKLAPMLYVGRPAVSFIAGLACGILVLKDSSLSVYSPLLAALCTMSATMFGFTINDIFDREKDITSHKYKPIAKNELSVQSACILCFGHLIFVTIISFLYFGLHATLVYMALFLLLFGYSIVSSRIPVVKGIYTAGLTLFPILIAITIADSAIATYSLTGIFFFIFFRECILDAMDIESDLKSGIRTVAFYLGDVKLQMIGWIGMFFTASYLAYVSIGTNAQYIYFAALVVLAISAFIYTIDRESGMKFSRVALLAGAVAIGV